MSKSDKNITFIGANLHPCLQSKANKIVNERDSSIFKITGVFLSLKMVPKVEMKHSNIKMLKSYSFLAKMLELIESCLYLPSQITAQLSMLNCLVDACIPKAE